MIVSQQSVAEALGGSIVLGREVHNDREVADLVRTGIPWRAAFCLQSRFDLTDGELATMLSMNVDTLSQHRGGHETLPTTQSELLYRGASVLSEAAYVLEDTGRAMNWLRRPQIGLGGRVPMDILVTDTGAAHIEALLGRIEFGVYS